MNFEDDLIMIPGPVPVTPRILRTMSKPMISHRGPEFSNLYRGIQEKLTDILKTKNDIFILSGSGTCAMEAAIGNVIDECDSVVTVVNGKFGDRLKLIGNRYGKTIPVEYDWGASIDLEDVESALDRGAKAVAMVHNETSTGILNPAKEVCKLAKRYDALFILDCITSIGGIDVPIDDFGVDIAISGSQKCLGAPPGLSLISVSERAFEAICGKVPFYMDLREYKKSSKKGQTPYTPAISLFFALDESLCMIEEEGINNRILRHEKLAKAMRAAIDALGLVMFPKLNRVSRYSNTVTAVNMPGGITDKQLKEGMRSHGIIIAGGQGHLKEKIFRIGTMGNITGGDLLRTISAIETVLSENKVIGKPGSGVEAANEILNI